MSKFLQLQFVDSHTGGEPTRVIVDGYPAALAGCSMTEARELLRSDYDWIRTASVNEPRGSDAVVGALLLPAVLPECDAGVVFFNNSGYLDMCVHGTIGLAVTMVHLDRLEPGNTLRLETPVGRVAARIGEANEVTVDNVPSYRSSEGITVRVDVYGDVVGDVAWGGNWFFLAQEHPMTVRFDRVAELTEFCWAVRHALARDGVMGEGGAEIDHVEVFAAPQRGVDADSQNFVLCPGGAYDRSPCGTGTSAELACLHAAGKLQEGEVWRQAGIVGSVFRGSIRRSDDGNLIPSITGSAHLTGEGKLLLDPADPFRNGISV
jgi:4-hydroxyproline epimerase